MRYSYGITQRLQPLHPGAHEPFSQGTDLFCGELLLGSSVFCKYESGLLGVVWGDLTHALDLFSRAGEAEKRDDRVPDCLGQLAVVDRPGSVRRMMQHGCLAEAPENLRTVSSNNAGLISAGFSPSKA